MECAVHGCYLDQIANPLIRKAHKFFYVGKCLFRNMLLILVIQ